jgi:3-hydroxyisobutyrate dehydrogenase-like beta-hydroxyacid dehydrogenase
LKKPSQRLTSFFICLDDDDAAIQETMEKIPKGDVKGKLIIDCSTVHPDTTSMTAKAIEARGGKFVACPLVCALAGPKEEVAEKTGLSVDALHQFLGMMFPGPYVAYSN